MSHSRKNRGRKSKAFNSKKKRVPSKALALSSKQSSQAEVSKFTRLSDTLEKSILTYLAFGDLICLMGANKSWNDKIMKLREAHCITAYKIFMAFPTIQDVLNEIFWGDRNYQPRNHSLEKLVQLQDALHTLNTLLWQQKPTQPTFLSSAQIQMREQIKKLVDENGKSKVNLEDHAQAREWIYEANAIFNPSRFISYTPGSADDVIPALTQDIDSLNKLERKLTINEQELRIAKGNNSQKFAQLKQVVADLKNEKKEIENKIQPLIKKYGPIIEFREKMLCSSMTSLANYFPYYKGICPTEFKNLAPIWNRYTNHFDGLRDKLEKLLKQLDSVEYKDALEKLQDQFDALKKSLDEKMDCSVTDCKEAHSFKTLTHIPDVVAILSGDPIFDLRQQAEMLRKCINMHEPPKFLICDDNAKVWDIAENTTIFWGNLRNIPGWGRVPTWRYRAWRIEDMLKFAWQRTHRVIHDVPENSYGHVITEDQVLRAKTLPDNFKRFLRIWVDEQGVYHCAYVEAPKKTDQASADQYAKRLKNVDSYAIKKQAVKNAWQTICKYSDSRTGVALPGTDLDQIYPIQSWVKELKVADKNGTESGASDSKIVLASSASERFSFAAPGHSTLALPASRMWGVPQPFSAPGSSSMARLSHAASAAPVVSFPPTLPAVKQVAPPVSGLRHFSSGSSSSSGSGSGSASGFDSKHASTLFSTAAPVLTPAGTPQLFPAPAAPVVALRDSSSHLSFFASSSSAAAPAAPVVSSPPTLPAALTYEALPLQQEDSLISDLGFFSSGSSSSSGSKDADFDSPEDNHSDSANFAMVAKKGGGMGTMGRWGRQ